MNSATFWATWVGGLKQNMAKDTVNHMVLQVKYVNDHEISLSVTYV